MVCLAPFRLDIFGAFTQSLLQIFQFISKLLKINQSYLLVWLSFQSFGLIDGWFKASSNSGIKVPFFLFAEKLSGLLFTPFQPHHAKVRPKTTWLSHKLLFCMEKNVRKTSQKRDKACLVFITFLVF